MGGRKSARWETVRPSPIFRYDNVIVGLCETWPRWELPRAVTTPSAYFPPYLPTKKKTILFIFRNLVCPFPYFNFWGLRNWFCVVLLLRLVFLSYSFILPNEHVHQILPISCLPFCDPIFPHCRILPINELDLSTIPSFRHSWIYFSILVAVFVTETCANACYPIYRMSLQPLWESWNPAWPRTYLVDIHILLCLTTFYPSQHTSVRYPSRYPTCFCFFYIY